MRGIFLTAFFLASCAKAPEPVHIPLRSIWAWGMPGTRNIRELDGLPSEEQRDLQKKSFVHRFSETLKRLPRDQHAGKGFAVSGTGLESLRNAVRARAKPPSSVSNPVSLVFFSHATYLHVHIEKVIRTGNKIEIRYRLKPYETMNATIYYALIPLGKLAEGEYEVAIIDLTPKNELAAKNVCKPFSFTVEK